MHQIGLLQLHTNCNHARQHTESQTIDTTDSCWIVHLNIAQNVICNDSQRLGPVLRLREPGDGGGAGRLARARDPPQPRPHREADGREGE